MEKTSFIISIIELIFIVVEAIAITIQLKQSKQMQQDITEIKNKIIEQMHG